MAIAELAVRAPAADRRRATVVARRTSRAAARSGLLWGYVFGIFVASSAWSYSTLYKTQAQRDHLAATFGNNKATTALFGPAVDLQTVAGFTVFKVSMTLAIIGSVWALLTGSRLLRGEEDAGRWDLLLVGGATRRGATGQALGGLGTGVAALWAVTALVTAVVGLFHRVDIAVGPAAFLALALVSPALMFVAVAALTSQLAPTRRQAAGYAGVVLAVSYALRMLGDAGVGLHALTWLSPLGWVEQLAPLTRNDPWPLLPIVAFTVVVGGFAVHLSGTRDVGSAVFPDRSESAPRLGLLGNQFSLSVRLLRGISSSWLLAAALFGLVFGLVAEGAGQTLSSSSSDSSVEQVLHRLGATGGGLDAYLAIAFLMAAALLGYVAAGQVGATRSEEADGRLDNLLVQPLPRRQWLGGRLGFALALVVLTGVVTALAMWLGAATQHSGLDLSRVLGAGVNAAVPAVFLLGIGALVFGFVPRAASMVLYVVLTWSLLVELLGGIGNVSHWLLDTSLFHHVASAPAVAPDWTANAVLVGIGVVAAVVGIVRFERRDLVGG